MLVENWNSAVNLESNELWLASNLGQLKLNDWCFELMNCCNNGKKNRNLGIPFLSAASLIHY